MKKSYLLFLMIAFGAVCSLASVPEPFEKKGKFGLIDAETGEVLVKPKYTSIVDVADGIAIVADKEYKGIINFQGKELVKCNMTSIEKLSDNYWLMVDNKDRIKVFSKSKSKQIQLVGALKAESNGITLIYATASAIKLGMPMYDLGDVLLLLNDKGQIFVGESALDNAFVAPETKHMPSYTEYREKGFEIIPIFIPFKSYDGSEFFIYGMDSDRYKWQVCLIDKGNIRVLNSSFDGDNCEIKELNAFYNMEKQQLYVVVHDSFMPYGRLCVGLDSLYHCAYNDNFISEGYDQIRETLFGLFASRDGYWAKILVGKENDEIEIKCPISTKECPFVSPVSSTGMFIIKNDEGKMGVISPEGDFVLECVSDSIKNVGSQLMVASNGKTRIFDYKTKEYLGVEFDKLTDEMRDYYIVEINGMQHVISKDGKEKSIPFDKVKSRIGDTFIVAVKGGKSGLFKGTKLVFPFKYENIEEYGFAPIIIGKTATGQNVACNFDGTIVAAQGVYSGFGLCVSNHLMVKKGKLWGIINVSTGKVVVAPCVCKAVCANDNSVIIEKDLGNGKAKLIAYSDSGKILGSRVASRMAMYSTSHALDLVVWMGTVCPYYKDYSIF